MSTMTVIMPVALTSSVMIGVVLAMPSVSPLWVISFPFVRIEGVMFPMFWSWISFIRKVRSRGSHGMSHVERSRKHRMGADMMSEKIRRGGSAYVREIRVDIFMM